MFHALQEGGATMWLLLLCSISANPFALIAVVAAFLTKNRAWVIGLGIAAITFGVMTLLFGVASYFYWMSIVRQAIAYAELSAQTLLLERGHEEAMNNIWLAVGGSAAPLVLGSVAVVRGALMRTEAK